MSANTLPKLALGVLLLQGLLAKLRHYDWSVVRTIEVVAGRTLIVQSVNGNLSAPPLHVDNGDMLSINVTNNMPDIGVSIHWHGFMMKGSQIYDGPVGLTQCPIAPGESFTYKWKVDENPGTYWWHIHSGIPLVGHDFARGPLIVHPAGSGRPDLEHYEETMNEKILFYQHLFPTFLFADYLLGLGGLGPSPEKGIEGFYESPIRWSNGVVNGDRNLLINVLAGQKYKLRLLNGGHAFPYIWSVDKHNVTVVAVDGAAVEPYLTHALQIGIGERFDVEIEFKPELKNTTCFIRALTPAQKVGNGIYSIIWVHEGIIDPDVKHMPYPSTDYTPPLNMLNCVLHKMFDEFNCVPITVLKPVEILDIPSLEYQDLEFNLVDFDDEGAPYSAHFVSLNNGVFSQTALPKKAMIRSDFTQQDLHPHTVVLNLELGKTVIMIFRSATAFPHPIHLHGHKFEILEVVPRKVNECPHSRCEWMDLHTSFSQSVGELARTPTKGVLKDTFILPIGGMAIIRFVSDNPGVWAVHCHLDQHLENGQIFIMDEGGYRQSDFPEDYPSCEYKGRLQQKERPACQCMEHLSVYKPHRDWSDLKSFYQCSEPHLCDPSKIGQDNAIAFAEYIHKNPLYKYARFSPEFDTPFSAIEERFMSEAIKSADEFTITNSNTNH